MGLALTARRLSSLDDDLSEKLARDLDASATRRTTPVSAHKWSKQERK
jgi:hypothetical protein